MTQARSVAPACTQPVGLLAGWGRFPILFAEKAKSLHIPVVCVGIRHEASAELIPLVHRFYWSGLGKMGRTIRFLRNQGIRQMVMAGKIHKVNLLQPWLFLRYLPDWRGIRFWWRRSAPGVARPDEINRIRSGGGAITRRPDLNCRWRAVRPLTQPSQWQPVPGVKPGRQSYNRPG